MSKNLVIVESPAKWKTIEKFLWSDYKVVASMWHIRDLPEKELWVDIDNGFSPKYQISTEKKKTVDNLKSLASKSQEVWIATDEDREWEAIGWHLCNVLDIDPTKVKRIVFHEITKKAIEESIKTPRNIDINLVDAQQARRILDRLVWYKVSPVLWKKIRKWLSAWRVQSVAVKMIVEREREIQNFKPKETWKISANLEHNKFAFKSNLEKIWWKNKIFNSREDVEKLLLTLLPNLESLNITKDKNWYELLNEKVNLEFVLNDIIKKDSIRTPGAPFTTSTLQQEASRKFWYGVKQTMMIAQKLYEWIDLWWWERQWLITYMRTDSVNLSKFALDSSKEVIEKLFWKDYHKERQFKTKQASAQEAHEAIRPVDLSKTPESLKWTLEPFEMRLYELIWKRTIASQMTDALIEVTTMDFSPTINKNSNWITKWEVIKFDWFMKLYIEWSDDETDDEDNSKLPKLDVWTLVNSTEINANQTFSRPPARYTEASLVKKMEWEWIGRPSTYAPTIWTIIDRWYIEKFEKKYLKPTEVAFTVTDFLIKYFEKMMDYKFTSLVEEDFDKVATWKEKYQTMLSNFWEQTLKKDLENAWENAEKVIEMVGKACPECGKDLVYKYSKTGKFIGCTWYPECKYIERTENDNAWLEALKEKYEWKPCPEWGTIVVKFGRFGPFLASSNYPEVKRIGKIKSEKDEILEEIVKEKWLLIDSESGEELVIKNSKRWPFLAAKKYPEVKIAKPIPKEVWDELKTRMMKNEEENEKT